jgi:hypothetical protein
VNFKTMLGATGPSALRVAVPGKLAQIKYGLRDVFISVEQRMPANLDPDKWRSCGR